MSEKILTVTAHCDNTPKTTVSAGKFNLLIDEPEAFGGENLAPSPVEFLLASIAGCISAVGQLAAKQMNIPLKSLDIKIDGAIDADKFFGISQLPRAGFQEIKIEILADADCSSETLHEWLGQVQSRCPVIDNLLFSTPVNLSVQKNKCL